MIAEIQKILPLQKNGSSEQPNEPVQRDIKKRYEIGE
jgi:hypothetical protein